MLQGLLAERFKLALHHEQKPVPVYARVVARNGPKLQEASADSPVKSTCSREGMQITCRNQKTTMADLARNLPRWVSRDWFDLPIMDQTGLQSAYNFSLTWTLTDRPPSAGPGAPEAADPAAIDLFDAIQDQLGLKLDATEDAIGQNRDRPNRADSNRELKAWHNYALSQEIKLGSNGMLLVEEGSLYPGSNGC